ncbi:uncharacterized protein LOC112897768 isoform X1 [Panicum hallii]|uniref:uncharacterized protein LOC112897768 isoform X1 n=1 Tax=Panicum hallii TaxID=206008 RepID=UPI000DF4D933|nr:uncharacterized protein LOC112897768 isoform X1 [Panicum hallii]
MAAAASTPEPSSGWDFKCNFEVDYGSEEQASIVYKTLAVDKELQPDKVKREVTVSGGKLFVRGPVSASIVQRICRPYGARDQACRRIWCGRLLMNDHVMQNLPAFRFCFCDLLCNCKA